MKRPKNYPMNGPSLEVQRMMSMPLRYKWELHSALKDHKREETRNILRLPGMPLHK